MSRGPKRLRLAVGTDHLVAVLPDDTVRVFSAESTRPDTPKGAPVNWLGVAVAELAEAAPGARVSWALLPPLVNVRTVNLPRLRNEEATAVLERHAARYFAGVRGPQVVALRPVDRLRGAPDRILAAAAPESWLAEARRILDDAGFRPSPPVPATDAWVTAARVDGDLVDGAVAVADGSQVILVAVRGGAAVDVALLPVSAASHLAERAAALAGGGPVLVSGEGESRAFLEEALDGQLAGGLDIRLAPVDPRATAARHATDTSPSLSLVPAAERAARRRREHRLASGLLAGALVLLVIAGLLELWGVNRELAAVRAERRSIASEVATAMGERESLDRSSATIAALDSLGRTTPAWAGFVTDLARYLPADAHLAALRGEPDSVAVEGVAADAAGVFIALRRVPGVREVRARSPIRREQQPGGAIERFSVAARLDARDARASGASSAAPASEQARPTADGGGS